MEEEKTFKYDELYALCLLCAANAVLITVQEKYTNEFQGREMIEKTIKELIELRWNISNEKANLD